MKIPLYIYSSFYFSFSIGLVTNYILRMHARLSCISQVLKSIFKRSDGKKIVHVEALSRNNDSKVIANLAEIYQDLIESCDEINICYGFPLMLGFGLIFFLTLFTSFTVYTDFLDGGFLTGSYSTLGFCIYYNLILISLIVTCNRLDIGVRFHFDLSNKLFLAFDRLLKIRQVKNILKDLNNLMKESRNELEMSMLLSFSMFVKNRQPKITCGLFDYNWNLVYSIIGSASTNFMILMQFDLASRRKNA